MWNAAAKCPLKELVSEYLPDVGSAAIWRVETLTKIHVQVFQESTPGTNGLIRLLQRSTNLQDLKLYHRSPNGRKFQMPERIFKTMQGLQSLHTIDFENIEGKEDYGNAKIQRFFASLPNLRKLRLVEAGITRGTESCTERLSYSALKDVEITDEGMHMNVFKRSKPQIIRNLRHITLPYSSGGLCESIRKSTTLEELSLLIYNFSDFEKVVALLSSIPITVKRLAIRVVREKANMNGVSYFLLIREYTEALKHLVNLERLILPWEAVVSPRAKVKPSESASTNQQSNSGAPRNPGDYFRLAMQRVEADRENDRARRREATHRAIGVACTFSNPKLEFVLFQGSTRLLPCGNPMWESTFDEKEYQGKRFAVKIMRTSNESEMSDGQPFIDVSVRAQVISTCCVCKDYWSKEDEADSPLCDSRRLLFE